MLIDCDTCVVRHQACDDCVVGVLLGTPEVPDRPREPAAAPAGEPREPAEPGAPLPVEFGPVERRALEVLADHGLIPRLRLVTATDDPHHGRTSAPRGAARRRDAG
jgi:hypothetical protein